MKNTINSLIREIVETMDVTALTITHDISSVQQISDNVALLDSGRIDGKGRQGIKRVQRSLCISVYKWKT